MATDAVVHPFQPNYGVDKNRFSPDIKRFSMVDEYELEKDFNRSSKKTRSDQEDKSKENESEHLLNNLNQSINGGLDGKMKKHRAARKRNRSDMSPEELRKLRERERKAQQSRRDRIRAQKRENQQWQDEDAAWEAFLDQTDCKKPSTKHNRSSMPSMVCSIDENQDTKKSKGKLEKQNSLESTTGSSHSTSYLSDDSSTHSSYKEAPKKNNKESEEEMTKIPEEEPLRRHHEEKLPPPSKEKLSHHARDEKPLHRNGEEKKEHRHHYHHHLPSPPSHPYHHMYHQKLSPHSFHPSDLYPKMFHHDSPIHHHPHPPPPYSPTEHKHFLAIQQHHHDKKHDPHHHDPHHHHYQPSHFMSTVRSPQNSPSSNHRENKKHNTSPQHEKKKVISRNVDRKKLSEEELEELRRRERDYQRERRARIRMEKAKTQAQQERFNACGRYPPPPPPPHAEMYRHHIHHHPQATDTIARYDHEHYRVSPAPKPTPKALEVEIPECEKVNKTPKVETDLLQVVPKTRDCEDKHTPPTGTSSPVEEYPTTKAPKKSLLESICSTLKKESSEWDKEELGDLIIDLKRDDDKRQTTPKMEPVEERVDDVHYLTKIKDEYHSKEYDDSTLSQAEEQKLRDKLTEEQLERRRKSNREAQRRRRARLKMQGHLEERHEFELHDELVDKEDRIEYKHCKNRPDSLYMSPYEGFTGHRGSPYHKERNHHEGVHYIHENYSSPQRVIMDTHYHHGNKHSAFYHSPHHRISEMDDSQRHRPHFYYDSPEFRHHLPHRYRDTHHRRHETVGEREREYTRSRSPHAHSHSRSTSKSATPPDSRKAPSPTPSDPQHHSHQHNSSSSRRESESKDDSISTSNEINDSTASKSSGRKRKQFAPRKLAATSVNTTPDEEVPVDESQPTAAENPLPATEYGDHPFEEEENKVVILPNGNEEEDLEENS